MEFEVKLGDVVVGILATQSSSHTFRIHEHYLELPQRPVLGQAFEDRPHRVWRTSSRLPEFFSNLLPEGVLRKLVAEQIGVGEHREVQLLARLGEDLAGAVVVTPLTELDEEELPRPNLESSPMSGPLRFSLAGVQAKFSVVRDADKFTFPARGAGGDWIVKLPDLQFESVPENEFSMLTWARAAGITVPEFHLVDSNDIAGLPAIAGHRPGPSLAVERFDRSPDRRIHIEDFAQVFAVFPEAKYDHFNYESIANVIAVTCGEASLREYVRRLVFMVVSGNADMHLKNWSLRYVDVSRPELAPAYDFVATVGYGDVKRELALNFSKSRSFDAVDVGHFHRLFQRLRRDPNEADRWVSEDLERISTAWSSLRDQLPISRAVRDAIDAHQRRVALLAHVRG